MDSYAGPFASFKGSMAAQATVTGNDLDYYFHVFHSDAVYYVCLSDDKAGRAHAINFTFLEEAEREFRSRYTKHKIKKAHAYSMEKYFSPKLRSLMHHYNTNRSTMQQDNKVAELHSEIDNLKLVMGQNINVMLNRGENLDQLVDQSEALEMETKVFRKRTDNLKKQMKSKSHIYTIILVFFVLVLCFAIAASICGGDFSRCRGSSSG